MQIALLAAGLGSRLGSLTRALPKALIPVAGETLLAHALRFAGWLSPSRVIVVGGFGFPLVQEELESQRDTGGPAAGLTLTVVENPHFREGNLLSLLAARPHLDDDFLLMNVDHIYRQAIAAVVAPPSAWVTAFVDTDRKLGADDMKVLRGPEGRVRQIAKTLTTFDAGYVGMTRVPRLALARYFAEAEAVLAEPGGRASHVERILARLGDTTDAPLCRDISGPGWLEIDTPEERAQAEVAIVDARRAGRW